MLKLINEQTGKEVLTIKDNGDLSVEERIVKLESELQEAFEKAKKVEE